jgi:hypothetical protein
VIQILKNYGCTTKEAEEAKTVIPAIEKFEKKVIKEKDKVNPKIEDVKKRKKDEFWEEMRRSSIEAEGDCTECNDPNKF